MNMRWAWTMPVLSVLATTLVAGPARAQDGAAAAAGGVQPIAAAYSPAAVQAAMYQQAAMQAAMYQQQLQQAAYMAAGQPQMPGQFAGGPMPDAYGAYGYAPTDFGGQSFGPMQGYGLPAAYAPQGYDQPMYDQMGSGGPMGGPMYGDQYAGQMPIDGGGCPFCGGQGCQHCGGLFGHRGDGTHLPNGLIGDCLGLIAPYPDGGCAAVRWFDFAVDYMALKRDNTGRGNQPFTSLGITGPIVLSANDLDFGSYKPGFRFIGAVPIGPANSVEFIYFGQFNYTSSATVRNAAGNLFSVYSQFGLVPFGTGFPPFDQANFQQIRYQSGFDSFEINWRNRWMAPNCRYQGSWTIGVRHFILDEKFRYTTASAINGIIDPFTGIVVRPAIGQSDTDVTNNLTGIQFGTDLWICLLPGLRVGGELQAGVYGNHMNINTTIGSNMVNAVSRENLQANDVSFIGQANLLATYRINYQWTLRGGYQFLWVDGVALALENFNPVPIALNNPNNPRVAKTNDNGDVFYHGWNIGLEFMW